MLVVGSDGVLRYLTGGLEGEVLTMQSTGVPAWGAGEDLPAVNIQNGDYTLVLLDENRTIRKTTNVEAITWTIPANASVAYPIGTVITLDNAGTVELAIEITSDTMTGTDDVTGPRVLTGNDIATITKLTSTTWSYAATDLFETPPSETPATAPSAEEGGTTLTADYAVAGTSLIGAQAYESTTELALAFWAIEGNEAAENDEVSVNSVAFTGVHDSGAGVDGGDVRTYVHGLLNPGAVNDFIKYDWAFTASPIVGICRKYIDVKTDTMGDATNVIQSVENNSATAVTDFSSGGGTDGNMLVLFACAQGNDMGDAVITNQADVTDTDWTIIANGETGTNSSDFSFVLAECTANLPKTPKVAWANSDENSGVIIEVVAATPVDPPPGPPDPVPTPAVATFDPQYFGYPRTGVYMISGRVYAEDNADGVAMRVAAALHDYVILGLYRNGPWDNADPDHLTRTEIVEDLITRNSEITLMDYTNVMERGLSSSAATKIQSEAGPRGTDWYVYRDAGADPLEYYSTFGSSYWVNITDYTTVDSENGDRFPQWFARQIDDEYLTPVYAGTTSAGIGGYNIFLDNVFIRAGSDNLDMNGDTLQDRGRSNYDAADDSHDQNAVAIIAKWRQGTADYVTKVQELQPGCLVTGNLTEWSREYQSGTAPPMLAEYVDVFNGGLQENQSQPPGTAASPRYGLSGISSGGVINPYTSFGSWARAYNAIRYLVANNKWPFFNLNSYKIDLTEGATGTSGEGRPIYPRTPTAGAFNLCRLATAQSLMGNNIYTHISTEPGEFSSAPSIDEFGTVNTGTTGLWKHWMGYPIDAVQDAAIHDVMWQREYDNCMVFANASKTADTTITVGASQDIESGEWARITGVQDNTANSGATITGNITLQEIDGLMLEIVGDKLREFRSRDMTETHATTATLGIRVDSDGGIYIRESEAGSYILASTWLHSGSTNADFEVACVVASGTAPTGTASDGSWLATTSDRTWELSQGSTGTDATELTITIRRTSDNREFADRTITFTLEVT